MYQRAIYCILLLVSTTKSEICPNQGRECNRPGECCSVHGWCGVGDGWCGSGNTMFPIDNEDKNCPQCPICPGENRTLSPTSQPIEKPIFNHHCHCKCYGDPHCQMWNCKTNNYQGPHGVSPAGQFYYITPCNGRGYDHDDMPFDVIGVHERYDNHFTSLDYTILKLYDGDDIYCIKTKGNLGVTYNTDCKIFDKYDDRIENGDTIELGDKFKVSVEYINGAVYTTLNILGNNCNDDLTLITSTPTIREEGLEIKMGDCYEKYTCGMCGNFYDIGLYFEQLDGSYITLSEGCWGGTANHNDGLSYLVPGTMGIDRRRLQDIQLSLDAIDNKPCYGLLSNIETRCSKEINEYPECCDSRRQFCDEDIVQSCKWDACSCVMNFDESKVLANNDTINQCVSQRIAAAMNFTCILPAEDFFIPQTLVTEEESVLNTPQECDDNTGLNIMIGIIIGCAIFIVIDIIIYFVCVKAALDVVKNGYDVTDDEQQP